MKKNIFIILSIILSIIFMPITNVYAQETIQNNDKLELNNSGISINIDGYFEDWNDKPASYEYNWDNSQNCWQHGVWIDDTCYKTAEGTYDTNVRHKMQIFTDKYNVYMSITFSKDYYALFNGEDYNFTFNVNGTNQSTKFQITTLDGKTITNNVQNLYSPGIYEVSVKHANGQYSGNNADGAIAYINIPLDYKNISLEFKIPYDQFIKQNSNINIDNVSSISFFTPNLMYRNIVTEGSPTGFIIIVISAAAISFLYFIKRRNNAKIL